MDVGTSAAVIAGITVVGKPGAELVKEFVGRIFGPTADALGQAMAHPIVEFNKRRAERSEKVLLKSAEILDSQGIAALPIQDGLLLPLLTNSSLVDDEYLQEVWSHLIATASASIEDQKVLPSFPGILAELTGDELRFLEFIYDRADGLRRMDLAVDAIIGTYRKDLSPWAHYLMFDNFRRLGLIELLPEVSGRAISNALNTVDHRYGVIDTGIALEPGVNDTLYVTNLGEVFMKACRGPRKPEHKDGTA